MKKKNFIGIVAAVVIVALASSFALLSGNSWRTSTATKIDTFTREINPLSNDLLTYSNKIAPTKEDAVAAIDTYDKHLAVLNKTKTSISEPGFSIFNKSKNKSDYDKIQGAIGNLIKLDEESKAISKIAVAAYTWSESIPEDITTSEDASQCVTATDTVISELKGFNGKYSITIYKDFQEAFEDIKVACDGIAKSENDTDTELYFNDILTAVESFDAISQEESAYIKSQNKKYDEYADIINTVRKTL